MRTESLSKEGIGLGNTAWKKEREGVKCFCAPQTDGLRAKEALKEGALPSPLLPPQTLLEPLSRNCGDF